MNRPGETGQVRGPKAADVPDQEHPIILSEIVSTLLETSGERGTHQTGAGSLPDAILGLISALATASAPSKAPRCAGPEFHEFDFWKGDWDAYDIADTTNRGPRPGHLHTRWLCCARSIARTTGSSESYNLWDAKRRLWHQSWVTNRGGLSCSTGCSRTAG
jgi:hypothetical protein